MNSGGAGMEKITFIGVLVILGVVIAMFGVCYTMIGRVDEKIYSLNDEIGDVIKKVDENKDYLGERLDSMSDHLGDRIDSLGLRIDGLYELFKER